MGMKLLKFDNSDKTIAAGKILCVGQNYYEHIKEMGNKVPEEPVIFLKTTSSLVFNNTVFNMPKHSENVHYEGELVLYIGKTIKEPTIEEAEDAIEGYAAGLDMTLRDVQKQLMSNSLPWTLSKCFDDCAIISDIKLKSDYHLSLDEKLTLNQNGSIRQNTILNDMIFKPAYLVKYIADRITLEEGDIIFTGTPSGVGKVESGDKISLRIENLPELNISIK